MNRTLFDAPAQPPARDPQPATVNRQPTTSPKPEPLSYGPDVERVIEHKAGPFRRLLAGTPDRPVSVNYEYRYLVMRNGTICEEPTDLSRRVTCRVTPDLVASSLASGQWVVVWEQGR